MTNHVHLLLTPAGDEACSLMMRDVGRDYAAYMNRRYERTGSLWERPFKSCLVDSAAYVLACYRYIERNPVRACMVNHPASYRWSSYAANALREERLITPHAEYLALAQETSRRRDTYRRLLHEEDGAQFLAEVREATHLGHPLLGERLRARLERQGVRIEPRKPGPKEQPSSSCDVPGQLSFD
jgi:putative transposase